MSLNYASLNRGARDAQRVGRWWLPSDLKRNAKRETGGDRQKEGTVCRNKQRDGWSKRGSRRTSMVAGRTANGDSTRACAGKYPIDNQLERVDELIGLHRR